MANYCHRAHWCSTLFVVAVGMCATSVWQDSAAAGLGGDLLNTRLEKVMQQQVADGFSGIAYVARGDDVLLYEGYGYADRKSREPVSTDTVIDIGSLSKQVTAAAAVRLMLDGRLSLESALGEHFSNVPEDKSGITVRQLLSHSSGLASWVFPDDFTPIDRETWLRLVFETPLELPPGRGYLYSNDGFTLVAMMIEGIVDEPFQKYLQETMFKPLRMKHTGWYDTPVFNDPALLIATGYRNSKDDGSPDEWPGPYWALLGNGGILWTVPDMIKWHNAVHKTWLPEEARSLLFASIVPDPEKELYPSETAPMHYGLGWRLGTSVCGDRRVSHTGTGVSHNVDYRYYRDRDLIVYVASNKIDMDYAGNETVYSRQAAEALTRELMKDCQTVRPG